MHLVAFPAPPVAPLTVRCECAQCGSHVMVRVSWQLSGQCGNCGGYELRELPQREVPTPPAPAPALVVLDLPPRLDVAFAQTRVA